MTRQKSRGSTSPACAYYQGDASRGEARAGPRKGHLPWPQKTARSRIGRSGHGDLWGGPGPANQGPQGAHSFTKTSRKRKAARPRIAWNPETRARSVVSGEESGGSNRRRLGACPRPGVVPPSSGHAAPGSAPSAVKTRGRPASAGSLRTTQAPGRRCPGGFQAAGSRGEVYAGGPAADAATS